VDSRPLGEGLGRTAERMQDGLAVKRVQSGLQLDELEVPPGSCAIMMFISTW
jgi:hypothetical protein